MDRTKASRDLDIPRDRDTAVRVRVGVKSTGTVWSGLAGGVGSGSAIGVLGVVWGVGGRGRDRGTRVITHRVRVGVRDRDPRGGGEGMKAWIGL